MRKIARSTSHTHCASLLWTWIYGEGRISWIGYLYETLQSFVAYWNKIKKNLYIHIYTWLYICGDWHALCWSKHRAIESMLPQNNESHPFSNAYLLSFMKWSLYSHQLNKYNLLIEIEYETIQKIQCSDYPVHSHWCITHSFFFLFFFSFCFYVFLIELNFFE